MINFKFTNDYIKYSRYINDWHRDRLYLPPVKYNNDAYLRAFLLKDGESIPSDMEPGVFHWKDSGCIWNVTYLLNIFNTKEEASAAAVDLIMYFGGSLVSDKLANMI